MVGKTRGDWLKAGPSRRPRAGLGDAKSTRQAGDEAETMVASWLIDQGYKVVCRNFRCRIGELDIIATEGAALVFVEVRSRASDRYGTALHAISPQKALQVTRVATHYLARFGTQWQGYHKRFDVVAVTNGSPVLIKGAFGLGELAYSRGVW